ncbi:MAG: hypothetical protein HY220_02690 [Candidatus Sungbacteria bacterium]|uniref:Tetratricopeptide repeat protein n=1 Tax=Candidatus Sungiibacteriota bacterium TaxID=2750080 RepID=A0A9D6LQ09_9BACT|nr:hypothetical protein [Candidatus Sungbacteria bacterium]
MKSWHAIVAVLFFCALILYSVGTTLAEIAWEHHRWGQIAIMLDRKDAKLASQIGGYYFNGGAYDLNLAEKGYKKAVAIDPKILWGHYQLARIYLG